MRGMQRLRLQRRNGMWHVAMTVQDTCPQAWAAGGACEPRDGAAHPCAARRGRDSAAAQRPKLTQGFSRRVTRWLGPWLCGLAALVMLWPAVAQAGRPGCPGPGVALERLSAQVWRVPGGPGEADEANRGAISNLLVVHRGRETWLVGSGPTPAFGRALQCQIRATTGWDVTDVIAPWPRPELVLGATAFPAARLWSLADVAAAMRERCPHCVERMQPRLAGAAADLGERPIRIAEQLLQGQQGALGPFLWWRLSRADATAVTVLRLADQPLWTAHGLLWADAPPDLRDAELAPMAAAYTRLAELAQADGAAARWLPEQGEVMGADAPARHARYLQQLQADVMAALQAGTLETEPPPPPAAETLPLDDGLRHSLNWQRAWHLLELRAFDEPPAVPAR
jgi:hypothetical protein